MDFKNLVSFLIDLQKNNNKTWMDQNRKRYKQVRLDFVNWLDELDSQLAAIDDQYFPTPGRKAINRINNNLMFHPHKPVYKDHFAGGLDKAPGAGDFYIEIGLEESLFAGGIWRPEPSKLRSIRDAIDYDSAGFRKILNKNSFKSTFGELYEDEKLKTAPKGFSSDHPDIDLLRNKSFGVVHRFSTQEVYNTDFNSRVLKVYEEMRPFRRFLNKAITV